MPNRVSLVENKRARSICESHSRYDICLDGKLHHQAYFNMRGYNASVPYPDGNVSLSDVSVTALKREVANANKAWKGLK